MMLKIATCFSPSAKESSLIFPAIRPPNMDSIKAACRNKRLDSDWDIIGLMKDAAVPVWLSGANIIFEITIIINRNIATEK